MAPAARGRATAEPASQGAYPQAVGPAGGVDPARSILILLAQRSSTGRIWSAFSAGRLTFTRAAPRSRNRFTRSGSSGEPPTVTGRVSGSRPASAAIWRKRGIYSSGSPLEAFGYQPSPYRT